jgi:hypothetical protein
MRLYLGLSLLLLVCVAVMFANGARKTAATEIACGHLVFLVPGGVAAVIAVPLLSTRATRSMIATNPLRLPITFHRCSLAVESGEPS